MKLFTQILFLLTLSLNLSAQKLVTKNGHVSFFSTTPLENIEAHNYKTQSVFNLDKGTLDFALLVKSFEFEKALMQQHFNEEGYMNSEKFPNALFKGQILNFHKPCFSTEGVNDVKIKGNLTIHGVTKEILVDGKISLKSGVYSAHSEFYVKLSDYGISLPGGASGKISEKIKITVDVQKYGLK